MTYRVWHRKTRFFKILALISNHVTLEINNRVSKCSVHTWPPDPVHKTAPAEILLSGHPHTDEKRQMAHGYTIGQVNSDARPWRNTVIVPTEREWENDRESDRATERVGDTEYVQRWCTSAYRGRGSLALNRVLRDIVGRVLTTWLTQLLKTSSAYSHYSTVSHFSTNVRIFQRECRRAMESTASPCVYSEIYKIISPMYLPTATGVAITCPQVPSIYFQGLMGEYWDDPVPPYIYILWN